ncbi:NUDIX domain-containing protein [Brucella pituitosa]|uniref:NUDIX hydrolase n=1 Tax=Brucella TaxID=234 RepID=UPI0004640F6C|nr:MULTISPECIES: NUDIX domain-containing protein [Brucella]PQZ49284.1 NUDIX domain-containing protein [Ochrobactrum sp. MYb19]PRA57497.1 NUDIX domain-containing protein [Ochrobactrum sp. MYb68]PRA66898.1 NUDIX domain-containing protein [Ochrobactrum sp. MYb18]PRA76072.1 NUDIX domain-containing protein [Brucella thiophenivorans]PRA89090.1 NUDIX domain-containing protein [Ochrobactrum sp. MYb29]PRA91908.1 NUDIX domain-containing protein [Ochrobactrum sp. MYb14]PRA98080.1 NUDIX domain-containin
MKTILIAAAIVRDEAGRFLLVRKRGSEIFFQPGGKIDAGEQPQIALIREIEEELGICIDESQLRFAAKMSAPAANELDSTVEAELFHLTLKEGQIPAASSEIEELIWLKAGDQSRPVALLSQSIQARFSDAV